MTVHETRTVTRPGVPTGVENAPVSTDTDEFTHSRLEEARLLAAISRASAAAAAPVLSNEAARAAAPADCSTADSAIQIRPPATARASIIMVAGTTMTSSTTMPGWACRNAATTTDLLPPTAPTDTTPPPRGLLCLLDRLLPGDLEPGSTVPASAGVPVLIHPKAGFDRRAAVPTGCRVITVEKLTALRASVGQLAAELADTDAFRDPFRVGRLLQSHGVTAQAFTTRYTAAARSGA